MEKKVLKKCAACGKEGYIHNMKVCMDNRPMHRYVCDEKCMSEFYTEEKEMINENHAKKVS